MLLIVFLLLMSALVSYESDIPLTWGGKHLEKSSKNSSVNPVSEEKRSENRQMHFVDPSFSSPTLSSHNSLDH